LYVFARHSGESFETRNATYPCSSFHLVKCMYQLRSKWRCNSVRGMTPHRKTVEKPKPQKRVFLESKHSYRNHCLINQLLFNIFARLKQIDFKLIYIIFKHVCVCVFVCNFSFKFVFIHLQLLYVVTFPAVTCAPCVHM